VNTFRYGVYHVLLDVDELVDLDREIAGFGYRRRAVTTFHDRDHFGPADLPVREKLARLLAARGHVLPAGRLQVVTNLRVFGHVFNPVSWWLCHDEDDRLALVVAEVNNTFGESHSYVLDDLTVGADGLVRTAADKVFHVSPFLDIADHGYRFAIRPPTGERAERVLFHMDVSDAAGRLFDATQDERRVALTSRNLRRALRRYPLVTLRTVYLIHRQALRLWRRRVPFFRKPDPPDAGYAATREPPPTLPVTAPAAIPPGGDLEPVATLPRSTPT
jgi:uncharacterized protein